MPATDQYWRKPSTMHIVFAGSAIVMGIATWLMVRKDQDRPWQAYQAEAEQLRQEQIEAQLTQYNEASFKAKLAAAEERLAKANEDLAARSSEIVELRQRIQELEGEYAIALRNSKFQNAERDFSRAVFDLDVRDAQPPDVITQTLAQFNARQVQSDFLNRRVQEIKSELDASKAKLARINRARDEADADIKLLKADQQRLAEQLAQLDPNDPALPKDQRSALAAAKRSLKEWPVIDAFNPHRKILYDWPAKQGQNLKQQLGMASVARVDRCRTCHVHINEFTAGNEPTFPKGTREEDGFPEPFCSHPNADLYLSSSSPHPIESFGCTICHGGDGSGTSFQNAEHTPTNPAQAQAWKDEHGWHSNHFWEHPMHPTQFVESSCIRCHHSVTELGVNAEHGASAPKAYEGYSLIKEYGCYGCHPINGYDGTKPIGPDLRLEPQTEAEALAIAEDPNQTAGDLRKVGPSLRHIASKVEKDFISYWTELPQRFRPDTRMPQFFHLTNQEDHLAELLQPVELAGIAAYLDAKSEPLPLMKPREGYEPDAERGKMLFSQRGCLACHSHDDEYFAGIRQEFGPNLTKTHEKIRDGEEGFAWLYTWLKEPTLHHPRTRMPNTYLDPEEKEDSYIDPAADIAAFLLQGDATDFPEMELPGVYLGVQVKPVGGDDAGVRVVEVLPDSPAERALPVERAEGQRVLPSLLLGDVILDIDGKPVRNQADLDAIVSGVPAGSDLSFTLVRGGREELWSTTVSRPLDDLVRLYLSKALPSAAQVEQTFENRSYPVDDLLWEPKADGTQPSLTEFIKGDEIELAPREKGEQVSEEEWEARKLQYIGRRTISRYGCYGCHEIPGFEEGRPIGTALQDWGRKDTSQLAAEHIEEYLHHHGEPDGSSTAKRVEEIIHREFNDQTASHDEKMKAFFYESLTHHGRPGFLWQKLRAPRSYDYKKVETKGWDERLRMPKFPFNDSQIESVATFVLGLVADPPPETYLYQPDGAEEMIVQGEKLLEKYNCTGCHILEFPGYKWNVNIRDTIGLTRPEIVEFLTAHAKQIADGTITQAMLAGREEVPEGVLEAAYESLPERQRRDGIARSNELLPHLGEFIVNCETLLEDRLPQVNDLTTEVAPLLGRLAQSRDAVNLQHWLDEHPETLIADNIGPADYADTVRLSLKLKPPVRHGEPIVDSNQKLPMEFHGLQYSADPDFGEYTYDLWENLDVGGRYKLAGMNSRFIVNEDAPVTGEIPGRGGNFMVWLYNKLVSEQSGGDYSLAPQFMYAAQQSSPPPLYKEGVKVQTPWLYNFLKNPEQLRFTTVLRMPRFNMSDEEAQILANYFAAVDGVPFPYQDVDRRDPPYLAQMQTLHEQAFADASDDYLTQAWKLINANQCIKCHSVGGRAYQGGGQLGPDGQPVDIRGPNLQRVQDRLRPEWTQFWIYNPKWFTPYTSMPANLPRDQENFPELYGGDGHWQNPALIDALMNYSRMMERLGVTVYDPMANQAPAEGEAPAGDAAPADAASGNAGAETGNAADPAPPAANNPPAETPDTPAGQN